jgi:hypothetical protein
MITIERPAPGDYNPDFERYVARVPEADVLAAFAQQLDDVRAALGDVPPAREKDRYAPDKWSVRQVVGHLIDTERIMGYRILAVARGDAAKLPGFDENAYALVAGHDATPLPSLLEEFALARRSHVLMLGGFSKAAWERAGTANNNRITVGALPYIMIGHVRHHLAVLRDKYGLPAGA